MAILIIEAHCNYTAKEHRDGGCRDVPATVFSCRVIAVRLFFVHYA